MTDTESKDETAPENPEMVAMLAEITPEDSAMTYAEAHAQQRTMRLRTADVVAGDLAPDFELPVFDFSTGTRVETGDVFSLQTVAANTPVALVFGSYT